jgi:hypothetical protein
MKRIRHFVLGLVFIFSVHALNAMQSKDIVDERELQNWADVINNYHELVPHDKQALLTQLNNVVTTEHLTKLAHEIRIAALRKILHQPVSTAKDWSLINQLVGAINEDDLPIVQLIATSIEPHYFTTLIYQNWDFIMAYKEINYNAPQTKIEEVPITSIYELAQSESLKIAQFFDKMHSSNN